MSRWILSRSFKDDIKFNYGIYPENGEDVVMEVVDRNFEYEQQAAGGENQAIARQVSDYENWVDEYDRMYEDQVGEQENRENDKMYD